MCRNLQSKVKRLRIENEALCLRQKGSLLKDTKTYILQWDSRSFDTLPISNSATVAALSRNLSFVSLTLIISTLIVALSQKLRGLLLKAMNFINVFFVITHFKYRWISGSVIEHNEIINPIFMTAKNLTMDARKIELSNEAFIAQNVTLKADTFSLTNFSPGPYYIKQSAPQPPYELISDPDLISSINKSINPCNDFYHYVCDGWIASHHLLPYESSIDQYEVNDRKLRKQINWIFQNRYEFDDSRLTHLMFLYYDKCANMSERNALKSKPLLELLQKVQKAAPQNATDWLIAIAPLSSIYSIVVIKDSKNSTQNQLAIQPDQTYISKKYYIDKKFIRQRQALRKYLSQLLEILENDDTEHGIFGIGTIERRVDTFMDIQTAIAKVYDTLEARYRDDLQKAYDMHSLEKIEQLVPEIEWQRYLMKLIPPNVQSKLNFETLEINTLATEIFVDIGKIIGRLNITQLADYIEWNVILSSVNYLDERYRNARKALIEALQGSSELYPNRVQCQTRAATRMPEVFNRIYISTFFNRDSKPLLAKMVKNIKEAFVQLIKNENWMSEITRMKSVEKIHSIITMIAYNELIFNNTFVDELYKNLNFNASMIYFDIVQIFRQFETAAMFENLLITNDRDDFTFPPPEVNALYLPSSNLIALFAGILQGAFFNQSLPLSMNYGGIGTVIGHEITHSFDDVDDWWDNKTLQHYLGIQKCFVEEYDSVVVPGTADLNIDGALTVGENIADNGGVQAAYTAMKNALSQDNMQRKRISGLEQFSNEQLFFINYAYVNCGSTRPEMVTELLLSDVHSPSQYRVNIPLGNMKSFFEAFNCPESCGMRPRKQCRLF